MAIFEPFEVKNTNSDVSKSYKQSFTSLASGYISKVYQDEVLALIEDLDLKIL